MTFTGLGEEFASLPVVLQLSLAARWHLIAALIYSNTHLTDGFIPAGMVRTLTDVEGWRKSWAELERNGVLMPLGDDWQIIRFSLPYQEGGWAQREGARVRAQRSYSAEKQARYRARKRGPDQQFHEPPGPFF